MNKRYLSYFAAILFVLLIIAPGMAATDKCTYTNVNVCDAKQMIENEDVFLLDVRVPTEYDLGHIEGAILIPLRDAFGSTLNSDQFLEARMKELPHNKNTKILVYCKSGARSAAASSLLVDAGYKKVYNIEGGIDNWVQEGYPIVVTSESWKNLYLLLSSK